MKKRIALIAVAIAAFIACLAVAIVLVVLRTSAHKHEFGDWFVTVQPTCLEYGTERRECKGCDVYEERPATRLGHDFSTENVCKRFGCGYKIPVTLGLSYTPSEDGSYYIIAIGEAQSKSIYLPRYFEEKPVDEIDIDGFRDSDIVELFIPDGLKRVGIQAFYGCKNLRECSFSITTEEICGLAFMDCESLTSAEIAPGVRIGPNAFCGCSSLKTLTLPDSVKSLDIAVFKDCTSLISVSFGLGLSELPESTFEGCTSLNSAEIREGVETIGVSAFKGCTGLRDIQIHGNLKKIGATAFQDCSGLRNINYGNTMAAWKSLDIARDWLANLGGEKDFRINCTDGILNRANVQVYA